MSSFDLSIPGHVVEGHRVASGLSPTSLYPDSTIRMQIPHFRERGLNLEGVYPGTINVSIAPRDFELFAPEWVFRNVLWYPERRAQDFAITRCILERGEEIYSSYVYYPFPDGKLHYHSAPSVIEILTIFVPHLAYGDPVTLRLSSSAIRVSPA